MTEQKLTVTGLYRPGWPRWPEQGQVPYLPLTGQWLAEAGFLAGTRVLVEVVEDGELVIRRVEEGEVVEARRGVERWALTEKGSEAARKAREEVAVHG